MMEKGGGGLGRGVICKGLEEVDIELNALKIDLFVDKLIVVVEKGGGTVHGGNTKGGDTEFTNVSRVSGATKDLGLELDTDFLAMLTEDNPPLVTCIDGSKGVISKVLDVLDLCPMKQRGRRDDE